MNCRGENESPRRIPLWIFISARVSPLAVNSTLQFFTAFKMNFMVLSDDIIIITIIVVVVVVVVVVVFAIVVFRHRLLGFFSSSLSKSFFFSLVDY